MGPDGKRTVTIPPADRRATTICQFCIGAVIRPPSMTWFRKPDGPDPTLAMAPVGPFADMAPPPPPPVPETRWRKGMRRLSRGFAVFCVAFLLLVGWPALTAPLSKSLEPQRRRSRLALGPCRRFVRAP